MATEHAMAQMEYAARARTAAATKTLADHFGVDPPATRYDRDPRYRAILEQEDSATFLERLAAAVSAQEEDPAMTSQTNPEHAPEGPESPQSDAGATVEPTAPVIDPNLSPDEQEALRAEIAAAAERQAHDEAAQSAADDEANADADEGAKAGKQAADEGAKAGEERAAAEATAKAEAAEAEAERLAAEKDAAAKQAKNDAKAAGKAAKSAGGKD